MKRVLAIVLIVCLLGGLPVFAGNETAFLDQVEVQPAQSMGIPLRTDYILRCAATVQDGIPVAVTLTSGTPATFNVVNLETGKLENYIELDEGETYWTIETDSKGNVYFASYNKPCKLYRYDPVTKQLKNLGEIPGTTALISLAFDDDDNPWLGTYPNASIVKYDVTAGQFINYGRMKTGEQYLQGLAYHSGKLYYCFQTKPGLYVFNPETGTKNEMPALPAGYTQTSGQKMFLRGQYIIALVGAAKNGGSEMSCLFFYDTLTGKWKDKVVENVYGQYISKINNGVFYYKSSKAADGHALFRFDMNTFTSTKTSLTFGSYIRGTDFVEVKRPDVAGTCFVNAQYNGRLYLMNFEKGKTVTYEGMLHGSPAAIRRITFDDQNRLYATEYMGTKGARWDFTKPEAEQLQYYHMAQGDSICQVGDQMIFGNYTGATLYQMDLNKPIYEQYNKNDPNMNPIIVGSIGEDQDRPTVMKEANGKAIIGSIPDYDQVGGALTIYDPNTKQSKVYRNLIAEQSITGLCYEDGIVYGSSSVACGLDTNPTKQYAEVFRFDMNTGKLLSHRVPNLSGFSKPVGGIGDVAIGPDGLLWAATTGMVFAMNKDTLEVVKQIKLTNESQPSSYKQYWWPKSVLFGKYGHLYVSDGGKLRIIDPLTGESRLTDVECGTCFVMDKEEQIYFYSGAEVKKAALSYRINEKIAAQINISGQNSIKIPVGNTPSQAVLTTVVKDRFGNPMESAVQWKLKENYPGVSVSDGTVQVSREAQDGEITVVAAAGGVSAEHKIMLQSTALNISITGEKNVVIPAGGLNQEIVLQAVVREGSQTVTDCDVNWSLKTSVEEISVKDGVVSVSPKAAAGNITVTAEAEGFIAEHTITLQKPEFLITMTSDAAVEIPYNKTVRQLPLTAEVKDTSGQTVQTEVSWKLKQPAKGVNIQENRLEVAQEGVEGLVIVTAAVGNASADFSVSLQEPVLMLSITGEKETTIPYNKTVKQVILIPEVTDSTGQKVEAEVVWALKEIYKGVSLNGNVLQITKEAESGEITVVGTARKASAEYKINLKKLVLSISISAVSSITIPTGGTPKQVTLNAEVKDQAGNRIDAPVTWSLLEGYPGVFLEGNQLKISRSASAGTIVILAEAGGAEAQHSIELKENTSGSGSSGGSGGGGGGSRPTATPTPTPLPTETPEPTQPQKPTARPDSFTDLDEDHWAYEPIYGLVEKGIIKGYEDGSFRPDNSIKREEFVKVIVEAFSMDPEMGELPFTDVRKDDWSYPYLCAAVKSGMIQGVSPKEFGYGQDVTREDAAVILERILQISGMELPAENEKISFSDENDIADYAKEAVEKMQTAGILNGLPDGSFAPKQQAARAEICAMVAKLLEKTSE